MYYKVLIQIRESLNLSQRGIAKLLNISKSTYARWETGEKIIPLKHLINLCNITKLSLDYTLSLTNTKQRLKEKIILDNKRIGVNIKRLRLSNNLTQLEFAESINTTQSVISDYEKGHNTIQTSFLYEICKKYKVSADYLLD